MAKLSSPHFLCIGAAKSATTSLFNILKKHPLISVSSFKEPHFFDNTDNYNKGKEWYLRSYFSNASPSNILGEFTPTYLSSPLSPKRILETFGTEMKFIVLLRNPIDRAYSHYLHTKRDEHESLEFMEALLKEKDRLKEVDDITRFRYSYVNQGKYAQHISNYLNYFSIDKFHFVLFEDFVEKKSKIIQDILSFLDLPNYEKLDLSVESNKASVAKSRKLKRFIKNDSVLKRIAKVILPSLVLRQRIRNIIHALNNKETVKKSLLKKDRELIYTKFFKEEIQMLEKMLNLDLNNWKEC